VAELELINALIERYSIERAMAQQAVNLFLAFLRDNNILDEKDVK